MDSTVLLKYGEHRDVRYQVYRDGPKVLQEIRDPDDFSDPYARAAEGACHGRAELRGIAAFRAPRRGGGRFKGVAAADTVSWHIFLILDAEAGRALVEKRRNTFGGIWVARRFHNLFDFEFPLRFE